MEYGILAEFVQFIEITVQNAVLDTQTMGLKLTGSACSVAKTRGETAKNETKKAIAMLKVRVMIMCKVKVNGEELGGRN